MAVLEFLKKWLGPKPAHGHAIWRCPQCGEANRRNRYRCSHCEYVCPRYWRVYLQTDRPDLHLEAIRKFIPRGWPGDLSDHLIKGMSFPVENFDLSNEIREALIGEGVKVGITEHHRFPKKP